MFKKRSFVVCLFFVCWVHFGYSIDIYAIKVFVVFWGVLLLLFLVFLCFVVVVGGGGGGGFEFKLLSHFCADSYFGMFHSCVTTVACKRYWSFCQKCGWQVTAKVTCTLRRPFRHSLQILLFLSVV